MTGLIASLFEGRLPAAVLFDLDGTLVDSVPDLATAVDRMLKEMAYPCVGEEKVRLWVGNGARKLVERALAHVCFDGDESKVTKALLDQAHRLFIKHYQVCCADRSRLYEGVADVLMWLSARQVKLACVTNKPEQFTRPLLKYLDIDQFFQLAVSGDTLAEKKPHPMPLQFAAQYLGEKPRDCLMVGDSRSDVLAARHADMKVLCLSYGYNHGEDVRLLHADAYADHFQQLRNT